LRQAVSQRLAHQRGQLTHFAHALHTLSPLATLDRGYAIVQREATGEILRQATAVVAGERIETHLSRGRLISRVEEKHEK
jgi:exodeoxyribonuclease VII large subunit